MALSTRDLPSVLRVEGNDNCPQRRLRDSAEIFSHPSTPRSLDMDLPNVQTELEPETGILWARLKHEERACYTPETMRDMRQVQLNLRAAMQGLSADEMPVRYLVWASSAPRVWSLGGDLTTFTRLIRAGDEKALRDYAHLAIDILFDNFVALDLPIMTVAVIEGDAIGGGFEAMLSHDLVFASQRSKFGLPETLFNLFPGMGAYSFLKRKLDMKSAKTLIEDGLSRSAEELKTLGLVDEVCAVGGAEERFRQFTMDNARRFNTMRTLRHVQRRVDPLTRRELVDVVDLWVDLAMQLGENDLRRMDALARVQVKKRVTV